jgi:hypothetical protein
VVVVPFGKYFQALQRAKARAGDLTGHMAQVMEGSVFPPKVDPYQGKFQEEMTRILFESELLADRYTADPELDQ